MAHKGQSKRGAFGAGTIRQKTVQKNGKSYSYWEARYTAGYDPGTGRQVQRSITGKTQREVAKKLREATAMLDNGTYIAPRTTLAMSSHSPPCHTEDKSRTISSPPLEQSDWRH